MIKIGVPAGIQSATFSISNVLIQSTINSFGSIAMAGSTAGGNIEGFVWTAMDAFTQSTLSFTGQNEMVAATPDKRKDSRSAAAAGVSGLNACPW